jgi:hypothetical protein
VGKAGKAPSTLPVTVGTTTSRKIPRAVSASVADVGSDDGVAATSRKIPRAVSASVADVGSDDGAAAAVEIVEVRL